MFTQTRTNLKIIGVILFTMLFFVSGFFINTAKGEAATITVKSFGVSYSLSSPVSNINKDGSISTVVLVGCAPLSGDLYDVNTGNPCNNAKTVLVGCKAGSGDIFDINTGIRCADYIKPVLLGCALKSGDIYDINTGNRCKTTTLITPPKTSTTTKSTPPITTTKTTVTSKALEISPIASNTISTIPTDESQGELSGREKIVNSILTGPMSIPLILLIIIILLGGGYAVYSLVGRKEGGNFKKIEVKKIITEPIIQHKPITPVAPAITSQPKTPTPQIPPVNTEYNPIPQSKTSNPQIPLDIP